MTSRKDKKWKRANEFVKYVHIMNRDQCRNWYGNPMNLRWNKMVTYTAVGSAKYGQWIAK